MLEALTTTGNRKLTFILLAIFSASTAAALIVGIDDNPPGIALALVATTALVLAFVHPWRTARKFGLFLCASILGFVVCGVLHNVFEGVAGEFGSLRVLQILLQGLGVVTFLIAILVCPSAILIGAAGLVTMFIRSHRWSKPGHGPGA